MLKEISNPLKSSINRSTNCTSNYKTHSSFKSPKLTKSSKKNSNNISNELLSNYRTINIKNNNNNNQNNNQRKLKSSDVINSLLNFYTLGKAKNKFKNLLNNFNNNDNIQKKMVKKIIENENDIKNLKKKNLIDNIVNLQRKCSHYNEVIENYKKCNEKTAKDNLEIGFKQDDILHERIHVDVQIPKLKVQINDMREEIKKLTKETKQYEILQIQYEQESLFMKNDIEKLDKKVKEDAILIVALKNKLKNVKNDVVEVKRLIEKKVKDTTFMKDVTKLIST